MKQSRQGYPIFGGGHLSTVPAVTAAALILSFVLLAACSPGNSRVNSSRGGADAGDSANSARADSRSPEDAPLSPASNYVHPGFALTHDEFEELTGPLPLGIRENIQSDPEDFIDSLRPVLETDADLLRLVDKQHPLGSGYAPDDLVVLDDTGLTVGRSGLELRSAILPDLERMSEAAAKEGITLVISSTYRSYAYQEAVFRRHVDNMGREEASRVSAEPGKSQHQLGTTVDFGSITPEYADTPAGKWLEANAYKYGFSMSYPEGMEKETGYIHECWHFRYITPAAALLERRYFAGVQQYMLEFLHEKRDILMRAAAVGSAEAGASARIQDPPPSGSAE